MRSGSMPSEASDEKSACRILSDIGRVARLGGPFKVCPFASPAMTRISRSRHRDGASRERNVRRRRFPKLGEPDRQRNVLGLPQFGIAVEQFLRAEACLVEDAHVET